MQPVNDLVLPPGQCMCCGGAKTPAVDLERDINLGAHDGRAYLCGDCTAAAWSMISTVNGAPGLVPAAKFFEQVGKREVAEARAEDYRVALEAFRGESPLTGALINLADTMSRALADKGPEPEPPAPDVQPAPDRGGNTISEAPTPQGTVSGFQQVADEPASVPADDAPASEPEPFPAPDAATEVPDDQAPPDPDDEAADLEAAGPASKKASKKAK